MKQVIKNWLNHPAAWWEFWWPQSGFRGGLIIFGLLSALRWIVTP